MEASKALYAELARHITFPGKRILEPSAGSGGLARFLRDLGHDIQCIELNETNTAHLRAQDFKTIKIDFLKFAELMTKSANPVHREYDYVVAIPPYKDNVDCKHIMAMYGLIVPGGKVISLTLPYWTTGMFEVQRDFRNWLRDKDYKLDFIEDDSYVNCPKAIIEITKH